MSIERQRARLIRRVVVFEVAQDACFFVAGIFATFSNLFNNLASTAKIAEIDAAKQYRDLVGSAVREIDGSLLGQAADSERG